MCSICKNEIGKCEKFITRKNPKSYKTGNILIHGLFVVRTVKLYGIEILIVLLIYIELHKMRLMVLNDLNIYVGRKKVVQKKVKANKSVNVVALTKS
jgi:hypothetical protein